MAKSTKEPQNILEEFFQSESAPGIALIVATVIALVVANSPLKDMYHHLLEFHIQLGFGTLQIDESLHHWINDGLMALFFLLVGLEIKREVRFGELSTFRSAIVPVVAAAGGAALPALIYIGLNGGTELARGWAIPMATDIAFVIGLVALLGSRVPTWAKVFVVTLAVVDDIFAVLVIAFFYTAELNFTAMYIAAGCVAVLALLNMRKVYHLGPYLLIGFVMWVAVLKSGVHATIAGVLLGFLIPAERKVSPQHLLEKAEAGLARFRDWVKTAQSREQHEADEMALEHLEEAVVESESPLHRLEHKIHPWVMLGIMPIFAFANAGVELNLTALQGALNSPVTWGIVLGLFFGKQIGIFGASWLLVKTGVVEREQTKETWIIFYGLAALAGVGFTMALFINNLAFTEATLNEQAKMGILAVSLINALLGYFILRKLPEQPETA